MDLDGLSIGIIIVLIGAYGLITKTNLIKMVMSLYIMNSGAILFFVGLGYRDFAQAAIYYDGREIMVDPLPQAVMLTSIVIGLGILSLALALSIKIYEGYKSLDTRDLVNK